MLRFRYFLALCLTAVLVLPAWAQKPGERPPSPVVVTKVTTGDMAPQSEFIGTVYFSEISNVAAEVDGKVMDIKVEDGQRIKAGDVMVVLSSCFWTGKFAVRGPRRRRPRRSMKCPS